MSEMYCPSCNTAHFASGACRCTDPLGFSPERLAQGEADAEAGRVRSLEEAMEALRARIRESESAALAAAREEGRREGAEHRVAAVEWEARAGTLHKANESLRGENERLSRAYSEVAGALEDATAAHAAQLVALREEACGALCGECADGQPIVGTVNGIPMHPYRCGVGGCNRHGGNAQACAAQAIRALPLPDAEAALAKVREGAVRPWRRYAAHLPECATRDPRPADAPENQCSCGFVALDALGGKP